MGMQDINWPHTRRVIINDFSGRPNKKYFSRLSQLFPDLRILGFSRIYDGVTWVLVLESKQFPYWAGVTDSGYISATSLITYLPKVLEARTTI